MLARPAEILRDRPVAVRLPRPVDQRFAFRSRGVVCQVKRIADRKQYVVVYPDEIIQFSVLEYLNVRVFCLCRYDRCMQVVDDYEVVAGEAEGTTAAKESALSLFVGTDSGGLKSNSAANYLAVSSATYD